MKANIKGKWIEYDYAINCSHLIIDKILEELNKNGKEAEYIGRSKAIEIDGEIIQLKCRSLFFRYTETA